MRPQTPCFRDTPLCLDPPFRKSWIRPCLEYLKYAQKTTHMRIRLCTYNQSDILVIDSETEGQGKQIAMMCRIVSLIITSIRTYESTYELLK